ncbi:MAG: hypothetical protein RMK90_12610 [Acetobacteraceae bacterium]|nr:hypothetical protein [Acetobacteraceae bacterium]
MGGEDHAERLARIEVVLTTMQEEMAVMRDALLRLVRIEEQIQTRAERERENALRLAKAEEQLAQARLFLEHAHDLPQRMERLEEQHAAAREEARRAQARMEALETRMDEAERRLEGLRGPLVWLAGVAATVVAGAVSLLMGRWL